MKTNWFLLVLSALAAFRLTLLLTHEKGPGWMFCKIRKAIPKKSSFHEGIKCPLCVSVYMATIVTVSVALVGWLPWAETPLWWLAVSALSIIIHMTWTKDL